MPEIMPETTVTMKEVIARLPQEAPCLSRSSIGSLGAREAIRVCAHEAQRLRSVLKFVLDARDPWEDDPGLCAVLSSAEHDLDRLSEVLHAGVRELEVLMDP